MPSSGYTAITFVADELLTSTKMNQMGANDAAFNNGNGFEDSIIDSRHYVDHSIDGEHLAADALRPIRDVAGTSTVSTTGTTPVDTGLDVTITVPSGSTRKVLLIFSPRTIEASGGYVEASLWRGAVGGGTRVKNSYTGQAIATNGAIVTLDAPGAGTFTYRAAIARSGAAGTITMTTAAGADQSELIAILV